MRSLALLPFCSLALALALSSSDQIESRSVEARAGQSFTNPDGEPEYELPDGSGSKVAKAQILSGVGPKEADDRWFDWDETCTDAGERQVIIETFRSVMDMADYTAKHLDELKKKLTNVDDGGKVNADNRKLIFQYDPAYAQMFNGQDNRIQWVRDTFGLISSEGQKGPDGRWGTKPGALRFICDSGNKIKNGDGKAAYCDGDTQALTLRPWDGKGIPAIGGHWAFTKSSSITFCKPFFDDKQFPSLGSRVQQEGGDTLDKVDNRERILTHEYTHVAWVRDLNPQKDKDYTGYQRAAQVANNGWAGNKVTPDCYAWLMVYAYLNNDSGGCKDDHWPQGENKPCKV